MSNQVEKKKKKEKCIDCEKITDNFYKIATNRGAITKCDECYELWILRSTRIFPPIQTKISYSD
jgi:NAD-dependent SIR2 family protein deacetylase